jgi:hypothetical protein
MTARYRRIACAAAVLGALAAPHLLAQDAAVFATDESSGEVLKVDFDAGTTAVVNTDAAQRERLGALAVRDDGGGALHLIVCDTGDDEVLFYANAQGAGQKITGAIKQPDGVSLLANGELVVANSRKHKKGGSTRALYRIARDCAACPGGYGTLSLIDGTVPAKEIADTRIVPLTGGSLTAGDLLVVTREPSRVFRYPGGSGPRQVFIDTGGGLPSSSGPTGLAFTSGGTLLIGTSGGKVLRFDASGQRVEPDFVAGLGHTRLRLAAGLDDGAERVFVSDEEGERLLRYDVAPDGTAQQPPAVVSLGCDEPGGIAIAAPAPQQIPVPVGTNITLQPTPEYEIKIEEVVGAGLLGVRTLLFPDPAPGDPYRTVLLSDVDPELPERVIPKHVRAFDLNGVPTFLLLVVDSTAVLRRTQQHHIEEADLGFVTDCASGPQPRTFYATDVDDAPIVEGKSFTDISTGCGSNIGRGGQTSLILTGYDTRSLQDVTEDKIERLEKALKSSTASEGGLAGFIVNWLRYKLKELVEEAECAFESGDEQRAIEKLEAFIAKIHAHPGGFDNSQRNVAGELEARAHSAIFMLCGASAPACNRELP